MGNQMRGKIPSAFCLNAQDLSFPDLHFSTLRLCLKLRVRKPDLYLEPAFHFQVLVILVSRNKPCPKA
jgi:hypothetical protein